MPVGIPIWRPQEYKNIVTSDHPRSDDDTFWQNGRLYGTQNDVVLHGANCRPWNLCKMFIKKPYCVQHNHESSTGCWMNLWDSASPWFMCAKHDFVCSNLHCRTPKQIRRVCSTKHRLTWPEMESYRKKHPTLFSTKHCLTQERKTTKTHRGNNLCSAKYLHWKTLHMECSIRGMECLLCFWAYVSYQWIVCVQFSSTSFEKSKNRHTQHTVQTHQQ